MPDFMKDNLSRIAKNRTKEKGSNWRGGLIKHEGYVYIYDEKGKDLICKNTRYTKRANRVWFENTGEIISSPNLLHHIDGNKENDVFENLEKTTRSTHAKIEYSIRSKDKLGRLL